MTFSITVELFGHSLTFYLGPSTEVDSDETGGPLGAHIGVADGDTPWFGFTPSNPDHQPMWEDE